MDILNNYKVLLKSIILAMIISLILLFILSVVLAVTSVKENIMSFAIIFISAISILVGAFFSANKIKEKGIIYGAIIGLLYMIILYFISSVVNWNFSLTLEAIIMTIIGIVGGAIGGILGVNLK